MNNQNIKKASEIKERAVVKKHTLTEVKDIVLKSMKLEYETDIVLGDLATQILPDLLNGKITKENLRKFKEKSVGLMINFEIDTHVGLMETFEPEYRGLVKEYTSQLILEYDCKTGIEKSLAEIIANAYIRIIDNSRRLNKELNCENITPSRNIYIANLSKQLDRLHRQFNSAVFSLKQLKQPNLEINFKATNAFVSQNQQINVNTENENIEA